MMGTAAALKRTVNGTESWQVYGLGGELLAEYPLNGRIDSTERVRLS